MENFGALICSLSRESRCGPIESHQRSDRAGYIKSRIARGRHESDCESSTRISKLSVKDKMRRNDLYRPTAEETDDSSNCDDEECRGKRLDPCFVAACRYGPDGEVTHKPATSIQRRFHLASAAVSDRAALVSLHRPRALADIQNDAARRSLQLIDLLAALFS